MNERFIQISRLNCGDCLLTKLYGTSFLFVLCVRTVSMRLYPLRGELLFFMLFPPFSFLCLFPLSFRSLLFAAFPISSNMLKDPWLFCLMKLMLLSDIDQVHQWGRWVFDILSSILAPWRHKQKNGGISADLLVLAYFLLASVKLPSWTSFILLNSSKTWTVRFCCVLNVSSVSHLSTAHSSTY